MNQDFFNQLNYQIITSKNLRADTKFFGKRRAKSLAQIKSKPIHISRRVKQPPLTPLSTLMSSTELNLYPTSNPTDHNQHFQLCHQHHCLPRKHHIYQLQHQHISLHINSLYCQQYSHQLYL